MSLLAALLLFAPLDAFAAERPPLKDTGKQCIGDFGSSSFRITVAELSSGRYVRHHERQERLLIGDDMEATGRISEAKLAEAERVLREFKAACAEWGFPSLRAVATAAFRDASNGARLRESAERTGIQLEIASGSREAELGYLSATLGEPGFAVLDIGSRTLELAAPGPDGKLRTEVRTLGFLWSYHNYFEKAASFKDAAAAYRAHLDSTLGELGWLGGRRGLKGIEIGRVAQYFHPQSDDPEIVIRLDQIRKRLRELERASRKEYRAILGEKHADRVLPRLVLLDRILSAAGYDAVTSVDRDLDAGMLVEQALR